MHYEFRVAACTASLIVFDVCDKIWRHLRDQCIPDLTKQDWLNVAEGFKTQRNFPNCLGALDGKHVRLTKPYGTGSEYFNYKKYFSMVLLAACDSNFRFTFVDIGSYGRAADSAIFKSSLLHQKLQNNTLDIPDPSPISTDGQPLPFVFIGDEAFGISRNVLRPYGGKGIPADRQIFNYRLSRARTCIEQAFGILTNKWRIFHKAINVNVDHAYLIIRACCILHNFVRERDGVNYETMDYIYGLESGENHERPQQGIPRSAQQNRERFTEYFISPEGEAAVPWQYSKIWV